MRRFLVIAALLALPALADVTGGNRVQGYPNGQPVPTTLVPVAGSPATFNGNGICATIDTGGTLSTVGFVLNPGTYNGTVSADTSKDNSNWSHVRFINPDATTTNSFSGSLSSGLFLGLFTGAGDRYARVCTSSYSSGTSTAFLTATNIAQLPPFSQQLPTSLDLSGFLKVHEQVAFTDNSAFSAGVATTTNIGGVFNDGLSAVLSGNAAVPRITAQRGVHVNLRDNSGNELGGSATPVFTQEAGEQSYFAGQTALTPYAGAIALTSNPAKQICVRNLPQSADFVWVGNSASTNSTTGYPIAPGEEWCRTLANTNLVFAATMAGASVAYDGSN